MRRWALLAVLFVMATFAFVQRAGGIDVLLLRADLPQVVMVGGDLHCLCWLDVDGR